MIKRKIALAIIFGIVVSILLSACASQGTPVSTEIPEPTGEKTQEPTSPAEAAVAELARQLGIDSGSIKVVSVSPVDWPNSCLGVPATDEMCMDVITPGYKGILEAGGVKYEFHSDERSKQIRFIPGAVLAAQEALAQELGASSDSVELVSFEKMTWRDSCLGVQMPGQMCLDVLTPGYRVVLQTDGEQYVYHTDESGNNLVVAERPQAEITKPVIIWSQSDEVGCQQASISLQDISFGPCNGSLTTIPFMSDMNAGDLGYFLDKYAPFEAQTTAGEISFRGKGSVMATPAEERMIAEWTKLTKQVAESGRAGAAWGLAMAWHREGGIAGFCDDLVVYLYGTALASSCKPRETSNSAPIYLSADQLEQLYIWVDSLSSFEYNHTDSATTDAMSVYLEFDGNGEEKATADQQQAILDFAAQVYTQAADTSGTE